MRTAEWLKNKRVQYSLTQAQLAKAIGVSSYTITNIEQGQRMGSAETWEKIENYFNGETPTKKISYESTELIEELKRDIEEFGEDHPCILIYKVVEDYILFTNYDFVIEKDNLFPDENDPEPFNPDKELEQGESYIETTFKYALEVFEAQNKII
ncbi:MAG: helix-turn-helix transcriptional regulator [Ruminococcus sp.]|nr:helix-turn-helix transcriptional regulator [Ruminococcus sp.]